MTQATQGERQAARLATQRDALDLSALALIAVVGNPEARRAILRHRNGRIETVAQGTSAAGGTVTGIDATSVTLRLDGKPLRLALPA